MKKNHKSVIRGVTWIFYVTYFLVMMYFLFFSDGLNRTMFDGEYRMNFTPFSEIKRDWMLFLSNPSLYSHYFFINFVLNIIAFVPFGFMYPIIQPGKKLFWRVVPVVFFMSVIIEGLQLLLKVGTCDVDDVIMNTFGGFIGWLLYWMVYLIYLKAKKWEGGPYDPPRQK